MPTDTLTIERTVTTAVTPSAHVLRAASMFGLGVDESRSLTIVPRAEIPLPAPGVVFITGPSGGGKSTVLRLIAGQCRAVDRPLVDLGAMPALPERPLVDALELPLERALEALSLAGLGDAFVMLRTPGELSDGQRFRVRLAQVMAMVDGARREAGTPPPIILADEFCATLDRLTAKILARNVRKWVQRAGVTFIAATTHDDLLEPLQPQVLVWKDLGEAMEVIQR